MALIDGSAVLTLFIVGLGYVPVIWVYKEYPKTKLFYLGYTCLVIGAIATILQSLAYAEIFQFILYVIGVMGSGILFCSLLTTIMICAPR